MLYEPVCSLSLGKAYPASAGLIAATLLALACGLLVSKADAAVASDEATLPWAQEVSQACGLPLSPTEHVSLAKVFARCSRGDACHCSIMTASGQVPLPMWLLCELAFPFLQGRAQLFDDAYRDALSSSASSPASLLRDSMKSLLEAGSRLPAVKSVATPTSVRCVLTWATCACGLSLGFVYRHIATSK